MNRKGRKPRLHWQQPALVVSDTARVGHMAERHSRMVRHLPIEVLLRCFNTRRAGGRCRTWLVLRACALWIHGAPVGGSFHTSRSFPALTRRASAWRARQTLYCLFCVAAAVIYPPVPASSYLLPASYFLPLASTDLPPVVVTSLVAESAGCRGRWFGLSCRGCACGNPRCTARRRPRLTCDETVQGQRR